MTSSIHIGADIYSGPVVGGGAAVSTLNTGWLNFAGVGSFTNTGTGTLWTTTGNTLLSDNTYAAALLFAPGLTQELNAQDLAGAAPVPGGATIVGVEARVEKSRALGTIVDNVISLVVGGVVSGNNNSIGSTWGAVDAYEIYGGPSDLWGLALTPAQINAANFGFIIKAQITAAIASAQIDHMQMRIYYTP